MRVLFLVVIRVGAGFAPGRGAWGRNQGGINQGTLAHQQAALLEQGIDFFEQRLRQRVGFQPVTKAHQGRGVRHRLDVQINAAEVA